MERFEAKGIGALVADPFERAVARRDLEAAAEDAHRAVAASLGAGELGAEGLAKRVAPWALAADIAALEETPQGNG